MTINYDNYLEFIENRKEKWLFFPWAEFSLFTKATAAGCLYH